MKKFFNTEYIVKRKMWIILLEAVIDAIILTVMLYYCLSNYNQKIIEFLTSVSTNNMELTVSKVFFPILLIITAMIKLLRYVASGTIEKKTNKKSRV